MPITIINGANSQALGGPMFSATSDEGKGLQTSGVLLGSRLRPVTFTGVTKGTMQITAPIGSAIVTAAAAQLVEAPTPIDVDFGNATKDATLSDALCTSFGVQVSSSGGGGEVQVSLSFEGTDTVFATGSSATPAAYTPITYKDCSVAGAVVGCILDANVTIATSYEQIVCLGDEVASGAIGALYSVTGTLTSFAGVGSGTPSGADVVMTFGSLVITVKNALIEEGISIQGATGIKTTYKITGTSDGTAAAFTIA
jgi:hypothetical protein